MTTSRIAMLVPLVVTNIPEQQVIMSGLHRLTPADQDVLLRALETLYEASRFPSPSSPVGAI